MVGRVNRQRNGRHKVVIETLQVLQQDGKSTGTNAVKFERSAGTICDSVEEIR